MACKLLSFNLLICLTLITIFILSSCRNNRNPEQGKTHSSTIRRSQIISLKRAIGDFESRADSISLFNLDFVEAEKWDSVGFVSVSDIDALPGSFDSPADSVDHLVIPSLKNKKPEETRYLILSSKYRKRLLAGTGISEADSLFIYDYSNDIILRFRISSLAAVANLSVYEDASEAKHTARDYQFGFQIDRTSLVRLSDKYFSKAFVYIGSADPFTKGKMRPVIWEETDAKEIPPIALKTEEQAILKGYKFTNAYKFEFDDFHYYLQEYSDNEQPTTAFRILIMNTKNEVVSNYLDYETESSSPAPISVLNKSNNILEQ